MVFCVGTGTYRRLRTVKPAAAGLQEGIRGWLIWFQVRFLYRLSAPVNANHFHPSPGRAVYLRRTPISRVVASQYQSSPSRAVMPCTSSGSLTRNTS